VTTAPPLPPPPPSPIQQPGSLKVWVASVVRNKAKIGALLMALGGVMQGGSPTSQRWSALVLAIGGLLAGGGMMKDDRTIRTKQAWRAAGLPDRRK